MLQYALKVGPIEAQLIKQAKQTRQPLSKKVADAPFLLPGLEAYYSAFLELSTCRQQGPIPWDKIYAYANYLDLDEDEYEDFNYLIRSMDQVFMDHMKQATENAKPEGPSKKPA